MVSDGTQGPIAINGIKPDDPSQPPARLELRDMRKGHPEQWNLFLLGMERFMDKKIMSEDKPLSYYQIAGIHGMPFETWPPAEWAKRREAKKVKNKNRGYCTHTSILFLTWHRPYLSLFEMTLYNHIKSIANEYGADENRAAYVKAAKDFRLPYWDWARPVDSEITLFPTEVWSSTVHKVIRPKSGNKPSDLKPNPLASYEFGTEGRKDPKIDMFPKINATIRRPNEQGTASDKDVLTNMKALFSGTDLDDKDNIQNTNIKGKNLTERTLFILQAYPDFGPMSSNEWKGKSQDMKSWKGWGSLEDIHNSVHDYVGGNGHMGSTAVSSFDPVFWLHHCNIDRLFAIWQALHSDGKNTSYVTEQPATGTRTMGRNDAEDKDTPLMPFTASEDADDFWTSDGVRSTKKFGYVYPETRDWILKDNKAIKAELMKVYTQGSFANTMVAPSRVLAQSVDELKARAMFHQQVAEINSLDTPVMLQSVQTNHGKLPEKVTQELKSANLVLPEDRDVNDLIVKNKYLEWLVDVKAEKHANGGDFVVHFFMGTPEDANPRVYLFNPTHVATFSTFGQDSDTGCGKCKDDQANKLQVTGQIPLTIGLVERFLAGQVDNLGVPAVEDYLKKNLHWRVTTTGGEPLGRDQINGLLIGVVTNEVTLPDDPSGLPTYAPNVVPRPAITINENGGARGDGTGYIGGAIPTIT